MAAVLTALQSTLSPCGCCRFVFGPGILSNQQRGAAGPASAAASAAGVSEEEPLVLPLSELLAVRRCAEPSLPEGAGIWISTQAMPTVSGLNLALLQCVDCVQTHWTCIQCMMPCMKAQCCCSAPLAAKQPAVALCKCCTAQCS